MLTRPVVLGAVAAALAGCTAADQPAPTEFSLRAPLFAVSGASHNLAPHLRGSQEVFAPAMPDAPTPADSRA
jgi:hypothetical protein